MRTTCLVALAFLIAGSSAKAADVAVESFDSRGKMTFSELTSAAEYRVDWTTNLATVNWSTSAPPGVASFASPGGGTRAVTVGVQQVQSFYRVVATMNADPDKYLAIDLSDGTNAVTYPVSYLADVPPGGWTDEYKTRKLVMRKIPHGIYTMGSQSNELGRYGGEV